MKRITIIISVLFFIFNIAQAQTLVIEFKNGKNISFDTNLISKIYFMNNKINKGLIYEYNSEINLNGVNQYYNTKLKDIDSSIITISTWYKSPRPNKFQVLLGNDGDNRLQIATNQEGRGTFRIYIKNRNRRILDAIAFVGSDAYNNNWHHIVILIDLKHKKLTFLFDMKEKNLNIKVFNKSYISTLSNSLFIGANNRGYIPSNISGKTITNFFNGSISNLKIYNRLLSKDEIRFLYNQGK